MGDGGECLPKTSNDQTKVMDPDTQQKWFASPAECYDACSKVARAAAKTCEMFKFGFPRLVSGNTARGLCVWYHGTCDSWSASSLGLNTYKVMTSTTIWTGSSGNKFEVQYMGGECLPNDAGSETVFPEIFPTVVDCFNACEARAATVGKKCTRFTYNPNERKNGFGSCWWEHGPCTSFSSE